MGYTLYWRRPAVIAPEAFQAVASDFRTLLEHPDGASWIALADGYGESGRPEITDDRIEFNGFGKDSYETFYLPRLYKEEDTEHNDRELIFQSCKTNRRPYDLLVCAALVVLKHHLGSGCRISGDDDYEGYRGGSLLCRQILGYGLEESQYD